MAGIIKPEFPDEIVHITVRTILSRMWFQLSPELSNFFYAALARYQEIHQVEIYSFVLMSNHYHLICRFPHNNRASFERDLNSILARSLKHFVSSFLGGKLWARPYRFQILPLKEDVKKYFLYTVLNPVTSGLTKDPLADNRPNALRIIRNNGQETFRWFNRAAYNNAKRKNPNVNKERYYTNHTLRVSRLPGYEDLSNKEYLAQIEAMIESYRQEVIKKRYDNNKGFLGLKKIRKQRPGILPLTTKTSSRRSYNPLVLCHCSETFKRYVREYLAIAESYATASLKFRSGDDSAQFPEGCYMPSKLVLTQNKTLAAV